MRATSPEFIIRIIVRARNEIAGTLQKAAGDVDKLTKAHERGTNVEKKRADASKATALAIDDARKRFGAYTNDLEKGNRSTEGAVKNLQSFRREFDRLGNRVKAGSEAADTLYQLGQQADDMAKKIKASEAEVTRSRAAQAREAEKLAQREAQAGEQRVATERRLQAEVARTVRAQKNARTEAERDAARARLSSHVQGLRDIGVPEDDIRRSMKRAFTDQDTDVAISRRTRRINELTEAQRRLRDMRPPQQSFLSRLFNVDEGRLEGINSRIREFEQSANRGGFSAVRLAGNLRGMVIIGAVAFFQQLVGIGVALGGTLVSVASAAIQAGAALGGALAAGAAQAIPVIGLLGAAWGRVGAVFDVLKKQTQAQLQDSAQSTKAAGKQADAADSLASAQDGVVSAQEALAESHRRVDKSQKDLSDTIRKARREYEDLQDAQRQAELQAESAALAQSDAQEALQRSLASGNVDELAQQSLQARQTLFQRFQASRDLGRATFDAARARHTGVMGMPDVVSAKQAVADAERAVKDAARGVAAAKRGMDSARRSSLDAADATNSTSRMLDAMLARLSPAERRLYGVLKRVRDRYKAVFTGPGGVIEPIINAFTHAGEAAYKLLGDKKLVQAAHRLSETIAAQLNRITDGLTSPEAKTFFLEMANEARRNLPVVVDILSHIAHLFMNIARAGSPALRAFLEFFDHLAGKAAKATGTNSGMTKLERFFMKGEQYAESIIHLTGAVGGLILALMGTSAPTGGNVIDKITEKTREATKWINTHQKEVRQFFQDAARAAGFVMHAVWELTKALFGLFKPDQVEAFSKAFEKTLLPSLVDILQVMGMISHVFLSIAASDVGSTLIHLFLATIGISKVIGPVISLFGRFAIMLGTLFGRVRLVEGGLMALRVSSGPLGIAISAIAATFLILSGRIHSVGDALKALGPIIAGLAFALVARNGLGGALAAVGGLLGRLPGGLGRVLGRIGGAGGAGAAAAGGSLAGRTRGLISRGGLIGGGIAIGGSLLGNAIGGDAGSAISGTATGAGIGATVGSIIPGLGTGIGAGIGGLIGFFSSGGSASAATARLDSFKKSAAGLADEFRREGDWKGLRQLARQADDIAKSSPEAAKGLHKFAAGARDAAGAIKRVNENVQGANITNTLRRELKQAHAITPAIVKDLLTTLSRLPFGARKRTVQMIVAMVQELVASKQLPAAAGKQLIDLINHQTDRIVSHAKKVVKDYITTLTQGIAQAVPIIGAVTGLLDKVKGKDMGTGEFLKRVGELSRARNTRDTLRITRESQQRPDAPRHSPSAQERGGPLPSWGKNYGLRGGPGGTTGIPVAGDVKKAWDDVNQATLDRLNKLEKLTHSKNKDVREAATKEYTKLRDDLNARMAGTARDTGNTWEDMRAKAAKKSKRLAQIVSGNIADLSNSVADAFSVIKDNTNNALGSFGAKELKFGVKKVTGTLKGVADSIANNATGAFHRATPSGKLIRVVEGGHDEVVLTTDPKHKKRQQSLLAQYLAKAPHVIEGFARGGFTNNVGAHVDTDAERTIARDLQRLGRVVGIMFSPAGPRSARRTPSENAAVGGSPTSNHLLGRAMDVAPDAIKTIANSMLHKFGLNRPMPGNWTDGSGNVHDERNHIELLGGAVKGLSDAIGSVSGTVAKTVIHHVKRIMLTGPDGSLKKLAQHAADKVRNAANDYIDTKTDAFTGGPVGGGAAGTAQVRRWATQALKWTHHYSTANLRALVGRVMFESGGDPHAINLWDSNAKAGHPSKGLGQTIDSTFQAYRDHRLPNNIYNPIANLVASIRYMIARYHHIVGLTGKGYEVGGGVPGRGPVQAVLHGGEHVWTAAEVARAGGHSAMRMLRRMLGGGGQGGQDGYAAGGRVALVGDSLGVGTEPYLRKLFAKVFSDVVVGRSSKSAVSALAALLKKHEGIQRVFFDAGTNDSSAKQFATSLRRADKISGSRTLLVPLLHGPGSAAKNRVLRQLAKTHDDIEIFNPGTRGVGSDGIHYSAAGYRQRAAAFAQAAHRTGAGGFQESAIHSQTVSALIRQIDKAQKVIEGLNNKVFNKKFTDALSKSIRKLIGDGGLLDQLAEAVTKLTDDLATNLKRATYSVTATGRVIERLGTVGQADRAAKNLAKVYRALQREQKQISDSLDDVARRLRNRHISGQERAYLIGVQRNLQNRARDVRSQVADNLEARYQAAGDRVTARTDRAEQRATRGLAAVDIKDRILAITGLGDLRASAQTRNVVINRQIADLHKAAALAARRGRPDLARDITNQITELQTQIAENIQTGLQGAVDKANNDAQRRQSRLDIRGRFADLRERAGDIAGAFADRGNILRAQGANLRDQRSTLQGLMQEAAKAGDMVLAQSLGDQLADLDASIAENTDAIRANTVAARQAAIDQITNRGGFLGGVYSGLQGIVQAIGELSGTIDTDGIKKLLEQQGTTLQQTGGGLADQLFSGFGIDLRGKSPAEIVQSLSGLNYDQIEAGMPTDTKAQFEGLINAIIENTGAQVGNTQAIKELTSPVTQSWATTAWQWFRNAVFNGAGGLLPKYQVPHMASGGNILSDGLIYAHASEKVVAANVARAGSGGGDVFAPTINNEEKTVDMSAEEMANKLMFRWKTRPKAKGGR